MKYTKEILEPIVASSFSVYGVLKSLGLRPTGGSSSHISKLIEKYHIDRSHFHGRGSNRGTGHRGGIKRRNVSDVLTKRHDGQREKADVLRRCLLESGVEYFCVWCGIDGRYNDKPLVLQVDHINGDNTDNHIENLRFLCPNCHSQTETFGSKNKNALVPQLV